MRVGRVGGCLGIVGVACTLIAALCLIAWSTAARLQHLNDDLQRAGADSARSFAEMALLPMRLGDLPALRTLARTIAAAPAIQSASVLDVRNRPLVRAGGPGALVHEGPSPARTSVDGDFLVVRAPLAERHPDRSEPTVDATPRTSNRLGWVQLELSRAATRRAQMQIIFQALGAALFMAFVAGALLIRLARKGRETGRASTGRAAAPVASFESSGAWPGVDLDATGGLKESRYGERSRGFELEEVRRRAAPVTPTLPASISHEIRTPMSNVLGYCNLLLRTRLNPAQTEFAHTIKSCTENLLGLVDGIRDASHADTQAFRLETTEFDLRECVEDVLALLAPSAYDKNLELACFISPYIPVRVRGNADAIRHVLINLVSNAIKYTEHGSVVVRVTLTGEDRDGLTTLFSVTDTGSGIDADGRPQLFKASSSETRAVRARQGTGLGLAICKAIVDSLKGEIGVESTPGRGSTFWFTIHCERCRCPPVTAVTSLEGRHAVVYARGAFTCSALREMLTSWGMQVDEARTLGQLAAGLEARKARSPASDVVILDLSRHHRHEAVVTNVRTRCAGPVVALLNAAEYEDARWLEHSVYARLLKPVRYRELQATLLRLVGGCAREDDESAPAAMPEEHDDSATPLRVLLADDDEVCRRLLVLLLRGRGVSVSLAHDGNDAVARGLEGGFDVILMDLYMPGLDGAAAAQRIRTAEQGGRRTPIIALTADPGPETRSRVLDSGMDDCLVKPVTEAELWHKLHAQAQRARTREAYAGAPTRVAGKSEQELHSLLLAELPARRSRIAEALERADTAAIGFEAHALAGAAAYCAVPALKQASDALKRAADFGRMSAVTRRVRRLNVEIDALLSAGRTRSSPPPAADGRLAGSGHSSG